MDSINNRIAEELGVRPQQVAAAVALLDEGSTVPFIARYRKEAVSYTHLDVYKRQVMSSGRRRAWRSG